MPNGRKNIIIIFEGVDKSGKSTLIEKLNKRIDFGIIVLDRFTTSSKVYDEMFARNGRNYFVEIEQSFKQVYEPLVVLCVAPADVIQKRLDLYTEYLPRQLSDINKVQNAYYKEIESFENRLILNTHILSPEECVEIILEKIDEILKRQRKEVEIANEETKNSI